MYESQEDSEVIDWHQEAEAVIRDVGFALKSISISSQLPQSNLSVFLNIETVEGQKLCVELSCCGFRVMTEEFDQFKEAREMNETYYETPYALLDQYSYKFRECFAAALREKLSKLES